MDLSATDLGVLHKFMTEIEFDNQAAMLRRLRVVQWVPIREETSEDEIDGTLAWARTVLAITPLWKTEMPKLENSPCTLRPKTQFLTLLRSWEIRMHFTSRVGRHGSIDT